MDESIFHNSYGTELINVRKIIYLCYMDEDEELYREMNEEDPFYMGDADDDNNENANDESSDGSSKETDNEPIPKYVEKPLKWWKVALGCLAWILAISSFVLACSVG